MKRAGLYIRVSTMEQAKEGYSIPAQTSKLKQYAKAKDLYVYKVYTDPGFSGAKLERPGLQELITDVNNHKLDIVLVYKLDRLSRSQKNTLYLIEDVFTKNNVDFISLQESFDTSTPFGRATIGMLSVFAQLERDTITERMHMGRTERAKQGYYHGSGIVPIGYDYIDGELVVNEYEAMIIREIYDLYVNKNKGQQHITLRMIEKYPDKVKTLTLVKYALRNPLYIGKISWDGEVYQGHHTPIIDEDTFNKAQELIAKKAKNSTTNSNQQSLFAGFIYCGKCGAKIYREVCGGKYRYNYYTCRSVKRTIPSLVKDWNCNQPRLRCEKVDEMVINQIKSINLGKTEIKLKQKLNKNSDKKAVLETQLSKKSSEKNKILDLYQFGTIDINLLNDRMKKINDEIESLRLKIADEMKDNSFNEKIERLNELRTFDWDNASTAEKIEIIKSVVKRVELSDRDVIVQFIF